MFFRLGERIENMLWQVMSSIWSHHILSIFIFSSWSVQYYGFDVGTMKYCSWPWSSPVMLWKLRDVRRPGMVYMQECLMPKLVAYTECKRNLWFSNRPCRWRRCRVDQNNIGWPSFVNILMVAPATRMKNRCTSHTSPIALKRTRKGSAS